MSDAGAHLHWKSLSASCTNDSPGAFHQPSACVHCSSCWVQTPTEYSALGVKPLRADATTLLAPSFPEPARLNKLTVPLFLPVSRLKRDGISVPLERCSLPQGVLVFVLLLKPYQFSPLGAFSSGQQRTRKVAPFKPMHIPTSWRRLWSANKPSSQSNGGNKQLPRWRALSCDELRRWDCAVTSSAVAQQ